MTTHVAEDQESDVFRHLFILDTPSHCPDLSQYWRLQLGSTLRKRLTVFADAPHGYYIVDDDRSEGEQEILGFFEGEDVYQALRELRQARRSELPVSDAALAEVNSGESLAEAPPMLTHPRRVKGARQGSPYHGAASHTHVPSPSVPTLTSTLNPTSTTSMIPPPPPVGSSSGPGHPPLSSRIIPNDCNSLIPLTQCVSPARVLNDALYTMRIKVDASEVDTGVTGMPDYILPIDTGSSPTWAFRSDFRRLVITKAADDNHEDVQSVDAGDRPAPQLHLEAWDPPDKYKKRPSVLGVNVENTDYDKIQFADTGMALLQRYPPGFEISALIPSWDWHTGQKTLTNLRLPRVLAYAGNDFILQQSFDGNLGLSIPGYTYPFDRRKSSTFFDAISASNGEGSHVKEPTRWTLRLLHPEFVNARCPRDVQSYMFFGMYWPCAVNDDATGTTDQNLRVPTFTPRILVFPIANIPRLANQYLDGPYAKPYGQWNVLLDSMALLIPKISRANRETPVPCRNSPDDWTAYIIETSAPVEAPTKQGGEKKEEAPRPLPVMLDTCTALSVLPDNVCARIGTEWLGIEGRITKHLLRKQTEVLCCPDELDIDDCDIRFTFLGEGGSKVHFQCSAGRFLKTVFPNPPEYGGGWQVPIRAQSSDRTKYSGWTLGQNFFWTAFVQFESTFHGDPTIPTGQYATENYVRLAPERVPDATGKFWLGEEAIRFHKLPGRLEAERLKSAGLKYDD